jgi:DNA-binding response OmpR family regulator
MHEISCQRILIVEDEPDIQQVLTFFLRHSGFETLTASDGQEAIRLIPEFCPHLIILDLIMRPVPGWEVLRWLRVNQLASVIPVLIVSALFNISEQMHGFEEGAIEYLTKPTQPSIIVEHVRMILAMDVEQRTMLQQKRIGERRSILERIRNAQSDDLTF